VHRFDARPEDMGAQQGQAFGAVASRLGRLGVAVQGPAVSCYEMDEDFFHVSSGFVVEAPVETGDGVEPLRLPDVDVATTTHVGPYEQLGRAYDALKEGAEAEGRHVDDNAMMWEEYLTGPEVPAEEMVTVVHWPLAPAGA
jgi:effector-binding domain-containing protein